MTKPGSAIAFMNPNCIVAITINTIDRIISAIRKYIASYTHILRRSKCVCVEESADLGIVISALQIIEPGLCGAGIATLARSYMIHTPQRGIS